MRLYESTGTPVTASVSLYGGVSAAHRTDLLEENDLAPLTVRSGQAEAPLSAADVATLRLVPAAAVTAAETGPSRTTEPVQPVYTRYWRHNTGPAPFGNLPLSVHVHPSRLVLDPGGTGQARITVSCSGRPTSGQVEFAAAGRGTTTSPRVSSRSSRSRWRPHLRRACT